MTKPNNRLYQQARKPRKQIGGKYISHDVKPAESTRAARRRRKREAKT